MKHNQHAFSASMQGNRVIDCAVQSEDIFYLLAQTEEKEGAPFNQYLPKRIIRVETTVDSVEVKHADLGGFSWPTQLCVFEEDGMLKPIVMGLDGKVWCNRTSPSGFEPPIKAIKDGGLRGGAITRLRDVGGRCFVATSRRELFARSSQREWKYVGVPKRARPPSSTSTGFEDMDFFSPKEMYLGGDKGDLWRYKNGRWRAIDFPSDENITALCCAGDGKVYVGLESGSIVAGRDDQWKKIVATQLTIGFHDIVWFQGRVWMTSDYGLWTLDKKGLEEADVPYEVRVCGGHLSVRGDTMLVAGYHGAAVYRKGQWETFFHNAEL
jgi:hypothetical protein